MIDLIKNSLNSVAKTSWLVRPNGFPSIDFNILSEDGYVYAEDDEVETDCLLEINIWTKNQKEHIDTTNKVKEKMKSLGFDKTLETTDFEKDTKIIHKILRFNYIKSKGSVN